MSKKPLSTVNSVFKGFSCIGKVCYTYLYNSYPTLSVKSYGVFLDYFSGYLVKGTLE